MLNQQENDIPKADYYFELVQHGTDRLGLVQSTSFIK